MEEDELIQSLLLTAERIGTDLLKTASKRTALSGLQQVKYDAYLAGELSEKAESCHQKR